MSRDPGERQTDLAGRPSGCERVHVVDASVLPSIPATPIVYTTMANASRIAAQVFRESSHQDPSAAASGP